MDVFKTLLLDTPALSTVNANVGSYGSATQVGTFTVDSNGRITAAGNTTITPAVGSITGLGTGVSTALAVNVGSAGSPVVNGGALGTPSSGTLTNATGLPVSTGVSGLGTGVATALGIAVGSSGGPVTNGGALGTPSSGNGSNITALNASNLSSGTIAAARMPAFTGDITTSSGAVATTLATVNSNVGSFTNASITVNAKGLITAASSGASSTVAATNAETLAGTDTSKYVTPASFKFADSAARNALASRGGVVQTADSSYVVSALTSAASIGTGDFSLSVVFRVPTSNTSYNGVIAVGSSASAGNANNSCVLGITDAGDLFVYIFDGAGGYKKATYTGLVTNYGGKVVHVVFTRSGTTAVLYVNGVSVSFSTTASGAGAWSTTITATYFGLLGYGSGVIKQPVYSASLYNVALSASDVTEIFELCGAVPSRYQFGSQSALYTSDFSGGTDSWSASGGSSASAPQTIGGQSNALKWTIGSGGNNYDLSRTVTLTVGKTYSVLMDVYVPSGNSAVTGASISASGDWSVKATTSTRDTWVTLSAVWTSICNGSIALIGQSRSLTGNGTDYIGLKNVSHTQVGATCHLNLDDGVGFQLLDQSSNKLHALMTATGVSHILPKYGPLHYRATSSTNGNQQLGGQVVIPANSQTLRVRARSRTGTPTVTLGTASGGSQVVASVALSTSWKDLTIALTGGMVGSSDISLWAGSNSTDVVEWDVSWEPLSY